LTEAFWPPTDVDFASINWKTLSYWLLIRFIGWRTNYPVFWLNTVCYFLWGGLINW
jgi:hypothetical protein